MKEFVQTQTPSLFLPQNSDVRITVLRQKYFLNFEGADETRGTRDLSTLCPGVTGAVAVLPRSLGLKAPSGNAIVMDRRVDCLRAHDSFVPSLDSILKKHLLFQLYCTRHLTDQLGENALGT